MVGEYKFIILCYTKSMDQERFMQALEQNDLAHRRTLVEEANAGRLTHDRFQEISQEATMWLQHLDFIYYRLDPKQQSQQQKDVE